MKEYTIGEIAKSFQNGIGKGKSFYGRGVKVANIGDLYEHPIFEPVKFSLLEVDQKEKGRYLLEKGDLLFVRSSLKREGVAFCSMYNSEEECMFSSFMIRVKLKKKVCDPRYVSYILRGDICRQRLINASNTSTITNINQEGLSTVLIPLPPLDTQQRIAAILDEADALRKKTQQLIDSYDELAESIFLDMFGDPVKNPKGWEKKKLGSITDVSSGSTPSRDNESYYVGNIPWIKTTELRGNVIYDSLEKISIEALKNTSCKLFPKGTILIAMYGQGVTRGKVGMLGIEAATNQACAALSPSDKMDFNFLFNHLKYSYEELRNLGRGGNQPNLNSGLVKAFKVLNPPLSLQTQFTKKIALIDQQKELAKQSLKESEDLFATLLQKAFKGELELK